MIAHPTNTQISFLFTSFHANLFATPQARQGPTSRVLKRRSVVNVPPPGITSPKVFSPTKVNRTRHKDDFANISAAHDMDTNYSRNKEVSNMADPSFLAAPKVAGGNFGTSFLYGESENTHAVFNLTTAAVGLNYSNISAYEIPATSVIDPDQTILAADAAAPAIQSTDNLFVDFLATVSEDSSGASTLDQVAELEGLVSSHNACLQEHAAHPNVTIGGTNVYRNMVTER